MHPLPPDRDQRLYGPQRIAAVVDTLADDGTAPVRTLAGSALDESTLRDRATRVSYRQVETVFRNALKLATRPHTAFRAGMRMHLTAYGMYGYGLLSSPTHEDQVDFTIKYNRAVGPVAGPVAYAREGAIGTYVYDVFLNADPDDALYRFALEFAYSSQLTVSRDLYGPGFAFAALHAAHVAPADADEYPVLFGCPVHFGHARNEVLIALPWSFDRRIPDPITHGAVREMCQGFLDELTRSGGTAAVVRRTLVEQMPWRFPSIEAMAGAIATHPRTLRRRLEREGTTYRDLLSEVRSRLAIEYLRKTTMSTEEIAGRLGYSDAANFRHAFARWTGKTPREYRAARPGTRPPIVPVATDHRSDPAS